MQKIIPFPNGQLTAYLGKEGGMAAQGVKVENLVEIVRISPQKMTERPTDCFMDVLNTPDVVMPLADTLLDGVGIGTIEEIAAHAVAYALEMQAKGRPVNLETVRDSIRLFVAGGTVVSYQQFLPTGEPER